MPEIIFVCNLQGTMQTNEM